MDKAYAQKLLKEQADELASKGPKGNKYHLAAQYFSGQVTGEGKYPTNRNRVYADGVFRLCRLLDLVSLPESLFQHACT